MDGVFTKALTIGLYAVAVEHVALFELPAHSPWVWVAGLLIDDPCYYWLHRAGHEVNVLWAAHVVHHQSERYNLTTALRQTSSGRCSAVCSTCRWPCSASRLRCSRWWR